MERLIHKADSSPRSVQLTSWGAPPPPPPSSLHKLKITEVGEGGGEATSFGEKVGDGGGSTAATSFLWSHF